MHLKQNNPIRKYYVENGDERVQLGVTEAEKDLGVIITSNVKTKLQAEKAIHRENHKLGKMRKTFRFFNIIIQDFVPYIYQATIGICIFCLEFIVEGEC